MADMNMPANDVPAEQAPAIAPPTRTDDQILPSSKWVPIGKSNCVLDVQKSQRNPIFPIAVAILKNTNFFRAFTASSTIPAIYIQQFWDTMCFNSSTGLYSCQLDEQWFNLHKDILRDALDITPSNDNNPFVAPPSSDTVIEYVNTLGYPCTLRNVSAMQDKTTHVIQNSLGITYRSNIDYKKDLGRVVRPEKQANKPPRPGSALYTHHRENIPEHPTEYQRYLNEEHDKADDKSPEPASSQPPKPTPTLTESSKKDQDEGTPEKEPAHDDEEANLQRALELSLKEQGERTQGPARPVVIREPDSGRIQPLPEEEVLVIKDGDQDKGQARPNRGEQDKGQAGSNPSDAAESQPQPRHVVHAGLNLKQLDLETTDASTQQKLEQIDEEFTTTAYPNVQENLKLLTEDQVILEEPASSTGTLSSLQNLDKDLSFTDQFFMEKPQEEEPGKTNAEAEVQSMVLVPIHQDTSSVPPMTTLERLDKHGSRLYKLENLNIPHQVSKVVDEIVTDAVDWAMQAPLRARFRDLPTIDMKEILQQ
ncbi:copia protein [Tanacetum coccineum]